MSSGKWRLFCLGLNMFKVYQINANETKRIDTEYMWYDIASQPLSLVLNNLISYSWYTIHASDIFIKLLSIIKSCIYEEGMTRVFYGLLSMIHM